MLCHPHGSFGTMCASLRTVGIPGEIRTLSPQSLNLLRLPVAPLGYIMCGQGFAPCMATPTTLFQLPHTNVKILDVSTYSTTAHIDRKLWQFYNDLAMSLSLVLLSGQARRLAESRHLTRHNHHRSCPVNPVTPVLCY